MTTSPSPLPLQLIGTDYTPALPGPLGIRLTWYLRHCDETDASSLRTMGQLIRRSFALDAATYAPETLAELRRCGEGTLADRLAQEAELVAQILTDIARRCPQPLLSAADLHK